MATNAVATRDHEEIRRWVEEHGGIPAKVKGTDALLRIDFVEGPRSGGREPTLEEIPWDEWFRMFDEQNLVFLHGTGDSKFFKLVYPDTLEQKQRRKSAARGRGSSAGADGARRGPTASGRGSNAGRSVSSGRRGATSSRRAGASSSGRVGAGSSSRRGAGSRGRSANSGSRSSGRRANGSARATGSSRAASGRGRRRPSGSRSAQASSSARTARSSRGSASRSSRKQRGRKTGDGGGETGASR